MTKLKNAPLQEAIFEVRWELEYAQNGLPIDKQFAIAQGSFHSQLISSFPVFKRIAPLELPDSLLAYQIVNQYWSPENKWPVIQLGPGILVVNETEDNYVWSNGFFNLIKKVLSWLELAYTKLPKLNFASLRYIDSVNTIKYEKTIDLIDFINRNFEITINKNYAPPGKTSAIHFEEVISLEDGSSLNFSISSGKYRKTENNAIIWQTTVFSQANFTNDTLLDWIDKSHLITSDFFKKVLKQEFYESFK
jgi:uncharacterized protein (TIGR04255 family)